MSRGLIKVHPTFRRHDSEEIMTDFSFLGDPLRRYKYFAIRNIVQLALSLKER